MSKLRLRQRLCRFKFLKFLASLNVTVFCLVLFFILTLWGTIAQVQTGLYTAQQRYFHSLFFLAGGFFPFPGGQAVMWVLFFNLAALAFLRMVYAWRNTGIIVIHLGILLFLVSGYVTLRVSEESFLSLKEGQAANYSTAYHDWEIAVWESAQDSSGESVNRVTGVEGKHLKPGVEIPFEDEGFNLRVNNYYRHAHAYRGGIPGGDRDIINASGIQRLEKAPLENEPRNNIPGGIFHVLTKDGQRMEVILFGGESVPASFTVEGRTYEAMLRLKRYPLPFALKLLKFEMEQHPGTEVARSFSSRVEILAHGPHPAGDPVSRSSPGAWREKLISMNNPLRYQDYTLYQSSYSIDQRGGRTSILSVVKNAGLLLPYGATFVTFAGLVIHFIMMAVRSSRKMKPGPVFTSNGES
jgi:hypothetical protein